MDKKLRIALIKGSATFIPGYMLFLRKRRRKRKNSCSIAEFCYNLWLQIVVHCKETNIDVDFSIIGELGTAGSLGVGICALLTGSKQYYALDIEHIYSLENNTRLFDEIIELFRKKTPLSPDIKNLNIKITDYRFPENITGTSYLDNKYIANLRLDLIKCLSNEKSIHFLIKQQWHKCDSLNLGFVFSRAVMEHVIAPNDVYRSIAYHLKKGNYMFHDIELYSHGLTDDPSGHYELNKLIWTIIYGRRDFLLNRWKLEDHIIAIEENFIIINVNKNYHSHTVNASMIKNYLHGATIFAQKV